MANTSIGRLSRGVIAAVFLVGALGCEDIQPVDPGDEDPKDEPEPKFTHVEEGGGLFTTKVDATVQSAWVALDLDHRTEVSASGAAWDIAFKRFHVKSSGGVSGTGGVEVAVLDGADFAALQAAPAEGYKTDKADGPDDDAEPDTVFEADGGWYGYDEDTHKLTPNPIVYVIKSNEGRYFKLKFLGYYDGTGTPGMISFRWGEVQKLP
jgi:hypothetical protein